MYPHAFSDAQKLVQLQKQRHILETIKARSSSGADDSSEDLGMVAICGEVYKYLEAEKVNFIQLNVHD